MNPSEDFTRAAIRAVLKVASANPTFTTDEVWALIGDNATNEPRALGGIMIELAKANKIANTGNFRKSTRKVCHSRPVAVWRAV